MSLEPGERFTKEIAYVTNSGKATVEDGYDTINIGPVNCEKGRKVRLKYLGKHEELQTDVGFALCLTEEVQADNYDDYIRRIIDKLIPDRPPEVGEEAYVEIDEIGDRNLGITILGGQRVELGPVRGSVGDMVRVMGVSDTFAKVLTESIRGENYEIRFKILSQQYDDLPVSKGDEVTTTIADMDGDNLIGYVGNIPIQFPSDEAEIAQKIDGRITGFDRDQVIGEITDTYDEVGRIQHANHWARMQWLKNAGFDNDPLRDFAVSFLGADEAQLPDDEARLRDTLIAEALRLAIADKTRDSNGSYPRAHVSGIRHWVVHKLAAVLGEPGENDTEQEQDDDTDWFKDVLSERTGPTITFHGDILQLSQGYYAPAPTHAVMTSDTEAVLVSGDPSTKFLDSDLDVEFRGISRVITNTSKSDLQAAGIPLQTQREYVGLEESPLVTESDLESYIETQPREKWSSEQTWEAYTGYGFQPDEDPLATTLDSGEHVSFWRVPVEYGTDSYRLKVQDVDTDGDSNAEMIAVPSRYRKHVCLILDALSGLQQGVDLKPYDGDVLVNCDFAPPRPQMRWLHAIGAEWLETSSRQLQWRIGSEDADSVREVFSELPVSITDEATGGA